MGFVDDLFAFGAKVGLYVLFMVVLLSIVSLLKRQFPQATLSRTNALHRLIDCCVHKREADENEEAKAGGAESSAAPAESPTRRAVILALCAVGLQTAYLTWGVLQESLMTREYDGEVFESSQFLVFSNRMFALLVAIVILKVVAQPQFIAPVYQFCFASFSNVMSSFCQYEALKFVTFPTQVIFKSSKMIPVMVMGKIIDSKTYTLTDYALAVTISIGVAIFTLSSSDDGDDEKTTTLSGLIYLFGYICFDSFTSQWQGSLFRQYKLSPYQMMAGINMFSATFTMMSLLISGEMWYSFAFAAAHPTALMHICILSLCGACGQLIIFYTIKKFGPLIFTIIMTTRQLIATILSAIIYGHHVGPGGLFGATVVFGAVGVNIWWKHKKRKAAAAAAAAAKAAAAAAAQQDDDEEGHHEGSKLVDRV